MRFRWQNLKYMRYVVVHKWYVMRECFREGLYWRGVVHDLSKLLPSEFFPYANYFYGEKNGAGIKKGRDDTGYYKPYDTGDTAFDFAWLLHQKRNRHHWQWWILPKDDGGVKVMSIREPYLTEMICDWVGAGKAQGCVSPPEDKYRETRKWYAKNGHKMQLHPATRNEIERRIKLSEESDE